MKTVIMAGGKGTRIAGIANDIPKPMIKICGKPILEYQINSLVKAGLTDILIIVGHLGEVIKSYFKDGSEFGAGISYFTETKPLGTAGALFPCMDTSLLAQGESFLLLNGDIVFDIDFERITACHHEKKALATLAVHPNSHPYDSALLVTDNENRIIKWMNKEEERLYYKNKVNAGIHILTGELLAIAGKSITNDKVDLDRDILKPAINTNRIFAYNTPEYIKDMGTPDRYYQVEKDITAGLVRSRNLANKQQAVFLDRDGTLNVFNGFITRPEDFHLIEGVSEAVKTINNSPYLAIVITNQPVIARGECSLDDLNTIHEKMESDLGKDGAYIDDLFYCPHHPDRGFPGERPEYKIDCDCRKPKPGMLLEAAKKYNIDLSASWMAGDDSRDILAGKAAGCKTVLLSTSAESGRDAVQPDIRCVSLKQFTNEFLK
ncbi:histidinol phosphate phosphatase [Spirochaetia bacterium]|nr:histidinol phosphate phosphatase [Spirochaetia bacterium]